MASKDLGFRNGVALRSQNGPASCVIDCENLGRGFEFFGGEGPDTVVDGFTVTNGRASPGGAFFCYYNSAPTITNCVITGNTDIGEGGGAIYGTAISSRTCVSNPMRRKSTGSGSPRTETPCWRNWARRST